MPSTHPTHDNIRLFIALPIPTPARAALSTALDRYLLDDGQLRRTRPEGWHITLAFLGDTPTHRLPDVTKVVTSILARRSLPYQITLGPPGRFGEHTLWIGVDDHPSGSIGGLGADLQGGLADEGLPVTRRELTPHIAVARARRRGRVAPLHVRALEAISPTSWKPVGVEIWQAHLGDGPARYTAAGSVPRKDTGQQHEAGDSSAAT